MQIVGSFAEFERAMLRERTKSGPAAARQDGRVGGRRPKLTLNSKKRLSRSSHRGKKRALMLASVPCSSFHRGAASCQTPDDRDRTDINRCGGFTAEYGSPI